LRPAVVVVDSHEPGTAERDAAGVNEPPKRFPVWWPANADLDHGR
jgi:hypothetical protein